MKKTYRLLVFCFSAFLLLFCQSGATQKKSFTKQVKQPSQKTFTSAVNIKHPQIYIELFYNQNNQAGLNARLRPMLEREFSFDGRMKVSQEKQNSDFILAGKIDSFFVLPVGYEPQNNLTRYQMGIIATVVLQTNPQKTYPQNTENLIDGNRQTRYEKFYSSNSSLQTSNQKEEELLEGISRRIVHVSLDNWFALWQNQQTKESSSLPKRN